VPRSNRTRHTAECPRVVAHARCVSRHGPVAARTHGRAVAQGSESPDRHRGRYASNVPHAT
jgi:hypothetical protein